MMMPMRLAGVALVAFSLVTLLASSARADLYSLSAGGTITANSSGDAAIPVGTPWTFELTYDTAAPDLDFEVTGSPVADFGRFTNSSSPPALRHFHYQAGSYEATIGGSGDFGPSDILITFSVVNAIDINISAPLLFPHLAGGAVSFHADFNAFSAAPVFTSDGLPTNTALGAASFDESTVTLIPPAGSVNGSVSSFAITPVPEPWTSGLPILGAAGLLRAMRKDRRR